MIIVVLGGTGLIGSKLVDTLQQSCLDVVSASRKEGVNTVTGEGLDEVLEDADVVIDVTKSPSLEGNTALKFYETSGRNIIAAEGRAGVSHHIALSVVGLDRLQQGSYFRAKLAQESLIRESSIPYTILRSTQFFEFLRGIADAGSIGASIFLPPAQFQPIAADDVVETLTDIVLSSPSNGMVEAAGPEPFSLAELVKHFLLETGDTRTVVADTNARYFGAQLNDCSLMPGENPRLGSRRFDQWLSQTELNVQPDQ